MRLSWFAALVPLVGVAHAQPDLSPLQRPSRPMREAAQQHYASGTRFFEEGQWDAALVEFEASWRLSGEADLLHNISWTHEKAGRTREALDYAERYLAACRGTEDEERAAKRVVFLKAKYGDPASGSCQHCQHRPSRSGSVSYTDHAERSQRSYSRAKLGREGKAARPGNRTASGRWSGGAGWHRLLGWGVVHITAGEQRRSHLRTRVWAHRPWARTECYGDCADGYGRGGWWLAER